MNVKQDFKQLDTNMVYVKSVSTTDLPEEVQAEVGDLQTVFAVHDAQGAQLALVADRGLAFKLARHHEMVPVTVH